MRPFSIFPLGEILLVSIQEEIDDHDIELLLKELGHTVNKRGSRRVIIDLHEVEAVDTFLATGIENLASMLYLLRASTTVVGLSVATVLTLLDFDIRLRGVDFALDVEQALSRLGIPADLIPAKPGGDNGPQNHR